MLDDRPNIDEKANDAKEETSNALKSAAQTEASRDAKQALAEGTKSGPVADAAHVALKDTSEPCAAEADTGGAPAEEPETADYGD